MPNNGDIAAVYEREDARERARERLKAEDASKVNVPVRLVVSNAPTEHDLKELAKAEQALASAISLPKHHPKRDRKIEDAAARRDAVQARLELRRQSIGTAEMARSVIEFPALTRNSPTTAKRATVKATPAIAPTTRSRRRASMPRIQSRSIMQPRSPAVP